MGCPPSLPSPLRASTFLLYLVKIWNLIFELDELLVAKNNDYLRFI